MDDRCSLTLHDVTAKSLGHDQGPDVDETNPKVRRAKKFQPDIIPSPPHYTSPSMLAKGRQSPAWTNQGYVCLSCRQQRASRTNRRQTRWNSTDVAHRPAVDDDIFALNDISESFGDKPRKHRSEPEFSRSSSTAPDGTTMFRPSFVQRPSSSKASDTKKLAAKPVGRRKRLSARSTHDSAIEAPKIIGELRQRLSVASGIATPNDAFGARKSDDASAARSPPDRPSPTSKVDVKSLLQALQPELEKEIKQKAEEMDKEAAQRERGAVKADKVSSEQPSTGSSMSNTWRAGMKFIKNVWSKPGAAAPTLDSAESVVASAVRENRLPVKHLANTTGSDNYKLVDSVEAMEQRPKYGGKSGPSSTGGDVFYFDSFRKKGSNTTPPANPSQPYGLPDSIAPTRIVDTGGDAVKHEQHPGVQSLLNSLSGKDSALPPSPTEEPVQMSEDQKQALTRLLGLYESRSDSPNNTAMAAFNASAIYKGYLSTRHLQLGEPLNMKGKSIEDAMEKAMSVPRKVSSTAPKGEGKKYMPSLSIKRGSRSSPPTMENSLSASHNPNTKPHEPSKSATPKSKPAKSSKSAGQESSSSNTPPPADDPPEQNEPSVDIKTSKPGSLEIKPLDFPQPPVPLLEYGLDRVLFNPGVYQLQDSTSRVYNFDPYLQNIMPAAEFDFDSLKEYKTSSEDQTLVQLARESQSRYIGSTSSMTSSLAHFHQLLSNWRPLNTDMLSQGFVTPGMSTQLTQINRAPSAIFLRWKNGTYAIDADKEYDSANVLMLLGKSMELLLTQPKSSFERYRKTDPRNIPDEERQAPETYQYTTMRDFLMRSQLDAYDPRLPGSGTFDLKTRAVVSVRMQSHDHEEMTGYEILGNQGRWFSYEKEYYDMMRSTMLKYMLQARMGRMNGIFVAYHNVERIFGFQYVPMADMDKVLHGQSDPTLGDQEFRASLDLLNEVLNKATAKFPEQSLRIHFETMEAKSDMPTSLHIFAEPMAESEIDAIQTKNKAKIAEFERNVMGKGEPDLEKVVEDAAEAAEAALEAHPEDAEAVDPALSTEVDHNDEALAKSVAQEEESTVEGTTSSEELSVDEPITSAEDATEYAREQINTSDSHADAAFLDSEDRKLSNDASSEVGPLFYATVIIQSTLNGQTPEDGRPVKLGPNDKWEIDYILKDYNITRHQWALYEDMKARRRFAFSSREDADELAEVTKQKKPDRFIRLLRGMADRGREWRAKQDEKDEGRAVVRVDEPLNRTQVEIESVDDYMEWMCGKKGS